MSLLCKYAVVCFLHRDDKTLFIDYTNYEHPIHQGVYSPSGGKIELGENPIQATQRELQEETGIFVRNLIYRGIVNFDNERRTIRGKLFKYNFNVIIYDCYDFDDSQAKATEGRLAWIEDSQILSLSLHEGDRELLKWLTQYKEFEGTITEVGEKLESAKISMAILKH